MPNKSRFGFKRDDGKASSIFGVHSKKNDVYIYFRQLGGVFKVSLHGNGVWRIAFTKEYEPKLEELPGNHSKQRAMNQWSRPSEYKNGVIIAFRILCPASSFKIIEYDPKILEETSWIMIGDDIAYTEITFAFTPDYSEDWPGKNYGTKLISVFELPNGEHFWILYSLKQDVPEGIANVIAETLRRIRVQTKEDKKPDKLDNYKLFFWGKAGDDIPMFVDLSIEDLLLEQ